MHEAYHRVASERAGLTVLAASGAVIVATVWLADIALGEVRARPLRRLVLMVSGAITWYWLVGADIASAWRAGGGLRPSLLAAACLVAAIFARGFGAGRASWARIRAAIILLPLLFVGSEVLLARSLARDINWPDGRPASSATPLVERTVTMVLLLDELNSRSAGPILEVLERHGMNPKFKAVPSVGPNTMNVLPAMFDGRIFSEARPCGPTSVCSGSTVLDFSRIRATRSDIDVVGFFHPYCAIAGLRSCHREAFDPPWFDAARWNCAIRRRLGAMASTDTLPCDELLLRDSDDLVQRVLDEVRTAPALTHGGVLFAHIPLPHPPGVTQGGTLAQHYEANIERAAALVDELLDTATRAGLMQRVIVASDHPLRQDMWCSDYLYYVVQGCKPVATLRDNRVPLIVAGAGAPDLSETQDNLGVFSLMAKWSPLPASVRGGY